MRLIDADNLRGRVCEIFLCAEPGSAEERRLALVLGLIDSEHTIAPPPNDPLTLEEELQNSEERPRCFYNDNGSEWCLGMAPEDMDEPIERCKRCTFCESGYSAEEGTT